MLWRRSCGMRKAGTEEIRETDWRKRIKSENKRKNRIEEKEWGAARKEEPKGSAREGAREREQVREQERARGKETVKTEGNGEMRERNEPEGRIAKEINAKETNAKETNAKETKDGKTPGLFSEVTGIWALLAKGSIYRILLVLGIMALAECSFFLMTLERWTATGEAAGQDFSSFGGFVGAVESSLAAYLFPAALGALLFILIRSQGERGGSRSGYTLMRLRLAGRQILVIQVLYNMFCVMLAFSVQALTVLGLFRLYELKAGYEATPQMLFLAFYQNTFLHNLLPMAEAGKWVRNFLLAAAFSMAAAEGGSRKKAVQAIMLYMITVSWLFRSEVGINLLDGACDLVYVICIFTFLWRMCHGGGEEWEEKPQPQTGR